jgi:beta-lactamase class A
MTIDFVINQSLNFDIIKFVFKFSKVIGKKYLPILGVVMVFALLNVLIFKPNLNVKAIISQNLIPSFTDLWQLQIDATKPSDELSDIQKPMSDYFTKREQNFDLSLLNKQIQNILGQDSDKYGVSIIQPTLGLQTQVNSDKVLPPASISKLPIAILILKDIDAGKFSLDTNVVLTDEDKAYESDSLYYYDSGVSLPIREYLKLLLEESDNTAMTLLERVLGGSDLVNSRTILELGVQRLFRLPMEATSSDVAKIWQGIYAQSYLSKSLNDLLIEYLSNIAPRLQDRIPQGVPSGVHVAHKIGEIETDYGIAYNDSGIVYGPKYDFIVVVIDQDVDQNEATSKIIQITQAAYNFFEK